MGVCFSYYTLMTIPMMLSVMLLSMLMIFLFIVSLIRFNGQIELASELECNLRDTVDWGRTQPVKFDRCNNTGAIDFKIDRPVLKENISFKVMPFSTKLGWGSYMISFAKTASKKCQITHKKRVCRTAGPSLASSLEPLVHYVKYIF